MAMSCFAIAARNLVSTRTARSRSSMNHTLGIHPQLYEMALNTSTAPTMKPHP